MADDTFFSGHEAEPKGFFQAAESDICGAFVVARLVLNQSEAARSLGGEERFLAEATVARLVLERLDVARAVDAMEKQQEIEKLEAVYGKRPVVTQEELGRHVDHGGTS